MQEAASVRIVGDFRVVRHRAVRAAVGCVAVEDAEQAAEESGRQRGQRVDREIGSVERPVHAVGRGEHAAALLADDERADQRDLADLLESS